MAHRCYPSLASDASVDDLLVGEPIVGYPDMTLRELANMMAEREISSVPIVDRADLQRVLSVMALDQLLEARLRDLDEEHKSERVLNVFHIRALGGGRVLVRNRPRGKRRPEGE